MVHPVVFTHSAHAEHVSDGHPEQPARIAAFLAGLGGAVAIAEAPLAPLDAVGRVHPLAYVEELFAQAAAGVRFDPDTYGGPGAREAALRAAGAAIAAVDESLRGGAGIAVMRPPGHHALPQRPMGFCLLANAAIAVRHARAEHGVERVAVVDWDVHHGNGTQAVFQDDPAVLTLSLHQADLWPFSGGVEENGAAVRNIPLPAGTGHEDYLQRFRDEALPVVEAFSPDIVVIACGLDAHRRDPLADLELEDRTYGLLLSDVRDLTERLGIPEPAVILEGGYDLIALGGAAAELAAVYSATRRT